MAGADKGETWGRRSVFMYVYSFKRFRDIKTDCVWGLRKENKGQQAKMQGQKGGACQIL